MGSWKTCHEVTEDKPVSRLTLRNIIVRSRQDRGYGAEQNDCNEFEYRVHRDDISPFVPKAEIPICVVAIEKGEKKGAKWIANCNSNTQRSDL